MSLRIYRMSLFFIYFGDLVTFCAKIGNDWTCLNVSASNCYRFYSMCWRSCE